MGKAFEKQTKTIKDLGEKQADALRALKPKEAKPVKYNNYFLDGLAEKRKFVGRIDYTRLTYNFKDPKSL